MEGISILLNVPSMLLQFHCRPCNTELAALGLLCQTLNVTIYLITNITAGIKRLSSWLTEKHPHNHVAMLWDKQFCLVHQQAAKQCVVKRKGTKTNETNIQHFTWVRAAETHILVFHLVTTANQNTS